MGKKLVITQMSTKNSKWMELKVYNWEFPIPEDVGTIERIIPSHKPAE